MPRIKLPKGFNAETKSHATHLQQALRKLQLLPEATADGGSVSEATAKTAISRFQASNNLRASGTLDTGTINRINDVLHDRFIQEKKSRTAILQKLLTTLQLPIDNAELKTRQAGESTLKAIRQFQEKAGETPDGIVSEKLMLRLHNEALNKWLEARTQRGKLLQTLQKVNRVARLNMTIAEEEINEKKIGSSSMEFLRAFQKKYRLPETGTIDKATQDKLISVANSKGVFVKKLAKAPATELVTVRRALRLNKVSPEVSNAQKALAFLGYKIDEKEFRTHLYGGTTRTAVLQFQQKNGLPQTGNLEKADLKKLNSLIGLANPDAIGSAESYKIRGSVRDELWQRKPNMVIRIFEKLVDGESTQPLATKKNLANGFFDILYTPPIDPATNRPKEKFHLVVKYYEPVDNNPANDKLIATQTQYNVKRIHWANYTAGDDRYKGEDEYSVITALIRQVIGNRAITGLQETENNKQVTQLALQTGLGTDAVMRLLLAHRVSVNINSPTLLSPQVIYAFLRQNIPSELPADLLRASGQWETISLLTERASTGIVFIAEEDQKQILENALAQNLVPRAVKLNLEAIVQEFRNQRSRFALTKPILVGNQHLEALLNVSAVNQQHYPIIAETFIENKGINTGFWSAIEQHSATIGEAAVRDFTATIELANMVKNHTDTVSFLKTKIGVDPRIKTAGSFAKLSQAEIETLITENGGKVPDNIPGSNSAEKISAYAAAIKSRSEKLYPALTLVGEINRSNTGKISRKTAIENFFDARPGLNIRTTNIDKYLADHPDVTLDKETLEEVKLVQRVHKLASNASAAVTLIDAGLHSSMQIYFNGRENLKKLFHSKDLSENHTTQVYEYAKIQYLQVLARLIEFSPQTNDGTPAAITPAIYSKSEIQEALGDIPTLETLFGSMDYCACEHCQSLYSPAAYLTDLLRFLRQHLAKDNSKTVKDILFERRPDIGNILLNCDNTNTALPYIDLVCEILENNIAPANTDFNLQTTLSSVELRAVPEHTRLEAYKTLATVNYPMKTAFNLFQEETRAYLSYLRLPRHELMETFQDISTSTAPKPADVVIAGEYFGMSSHELTLIITPKPLAADQDLFWKNDTTQATMAVKEFMNRSQLSYTELLNLLMVRLVNDPSAANRREIERPADTCDLNKQLINNLSPERMDRMHRFIRLWRRTNWSMWELDLLLRNNIVGNNSIGAEALVNLWHFSKVQRKLDLPVELLLAFYGDLNREVRLKAEKPDQKIAPLYKNLFQNITITNPLDEKFKAVDDNDAPIDPDNSILLNNNNPAGYTPVPTILSALALRQEDFDKLLHKTDNHLSVESLSILFRYVYLARALRLSITELLLLDTLLDTDPFAHPKATLHYIHHLELIRLSGFSLPELHYLLNHVPDSPVGLRTETLTQFIELLRGSLADNRDKIARLRLSDEQKKDIIAFNTEALEAMDDAALIAALQPLQAILAPVAENFKEAGFSIPESNFIISYTLPMVNAESRKMLLEHIRQLQQNLSNFLNIKAQVAASFALTDSQATILLSTLRVLPAENTLLIILKDESLIERNTDGSFTKTVSPSNFPQQYDAYRLLHKAALLIQKFRLTDADLKFFLQAYSSIETLNWSALPVTAPLEPNDFPKWLNLFRFIDFKSVFPEPEDASIRSVLTIATDDSTSKDHLFDELVRLTQWNRKDLETLDSAFQLNHSAGNHDYAKASTFHRLQQCFTQMKRTAVDAETMLNWANKNGTPDDDISAAQQARQAVKAKYEQADWLQKITPVHDEIREKKRSALSSYLIEHAQRTQPAQVEVNGKEIPNPLYWEDSNALFRFYLIDVEMGPLQQSSRIKQAISSVQLFVQRCFLNLENRFVEVTEDDKENTVSENSWAQWKWMKNYRIWEANRKVFFYPENWIEPELRDDKSPFFRELENDLMQQEVNKENIEAAFLSYLHKVDEISRLEVCGLYHEMENLSGDESTYEINQVHVIGRTHNLPHIYYYRMYDMNYNSWSAWEKIEVEISGDHVVPVIYNRKLHLFWLQVQEKPMKVRKMPPAKASTGPQDAAEPMNMLEIQLGWTVRKKSGWSAKRISNQKLIHPWERKLHSYQLRPFYRQLTNELFLDIYISTSPQFNNTPFYDPYQDKKVKITRTPFSETLKPWHSSSFIFNGEVKAINLKPLMGSYHLEPHVTPVQAVDSFRYVQANYDPQGKVIQAMPYTEKGINLQLPNGMHYEYNRLTNNKIHNPNPSALRTLEWDNSTVTLLNGAVSPFEYVVTQQGRQFNTRYADHPSFFQDKKRVFFIKPEWENILDNYGQVMGLTRKYRFHPFYHPYTTLFLRELNRSGVDGILNRAVQLSPHTFKPVEGFNFTAYQPAPAAIVDAAAQKEEVDFSFSGACSIYNWELFFHTPLMIACRLSQNQKFEDAMNWFHYIFNPTNIEALPTPQRYWVTKPFYEFNTPEARKQRIENILSNINLPEFRSQLIASKNNPFKPHLIARYRPVAYQKAVVMKYLDNLLAWGDMLFRRDTIESINEAMLLYTLAYELLGRRPEKVPNVKHEDKTFNQIEDQLDAIGNTRIDVLIEDTLLPIDVVPSANGTEPLPKIETFYFAIPANENITKYWDTVEDRLYKIRNSLNIQGVFRQMPLFEPPIDPALLVKAAAEGIDISSVLADLNAPLPSYRFNIVIQKAIDFCAEVKQLGDKLLQLLERKDAEELSLLRSQQELQLLRAVKEVKKKQIADAAEAVASLNKAFESAEIKRAHYESRPFMNPAESVAVGLSITSLTFDAGIAAGYIISGGMKLLPSFIGGGAGFGGTPTVHASMGGPQIGNSAEMAVRTLEAISKALDKASALSNTLGSYYQRKDEWELQERLASIESSQIHFQIKAAQIRQAIAEKELENHELQIEHNMATDEFMRNKYTNRQLYNWMITQVSSVYFQAYQLAFDMARKAEKCFQFELAITDSDYIQFGYWDSLRKGLLSGDKLMSALNRLQAAYIEQHKRELEITKHISLAQFFPLNMVQLRETGRCTLTIPEWLFDMDYPGHYMRRIKNISVSIPCITGPYTNINCTLSLVKNETRMEDTLLGGKYEKQEDDQRFKIMFGSISSIATSSGQNDAGMFELNFNDDRYLPFEGAGVISEWQIEMPADCNYFDFNSLSDFVLHVNYTARIGGGSLAVEAKNFLQTVLPDSGARLFNLRYDFGTEWYKFLHPENSADQEFVLQLQPQHFPFFIRGKLNMLKIKSADLFIESGHPNDFLTRMKVTSQQFDDNDISISPDLAYNSIHHLHRSFNAGGAAALGEVRIKLKTDTATDYKSLQQGDLENVFLLLNLGK